MWGRVCVGGSVCGDECVRGVVCGGTSVWGVVCVGTSVWGGSVCVEEWGVWTQHIYQR